MKPKFLYCDPSIDVSRIAYDLALIYAHAKFEAELRDEKELFETGVAPTHIEEKQRVYEHFVSAYSYYLETQPGEIENQLKKN